MTGVEEPGEGRIAPSGRVAVVGSLRRDMHLASDARALRVLTRLVAASDPAVMHSHLAKAGALGRVAAIRAKVPAIVHTFHGHVLEGYFSSWRTKAFVRVERELARRTDALVAVSPQIRDELLALGIGTPDRWRVIRVGLDLTSLLRERPDPMSARRTLGLPVESPTVGIVGRLAPIKDHETFLRAAAMATRRHPDLQVVVAGDGPLRQRLEGRAREALGDRVRFLGWVDDLVALYAALDVVVLTSRNEGTPVSLIEAVAAGRPVVATKVGGVPDVIEVGESRELVPAGAPDAVADALDRLLTDPGPEPAREAAAVVVGERFGDERLANELASLYRELLGGGDR